jgi:hypothetical protein
MLIARIRRYKPGWWLLHLVVVPLTIWLGHLVRFQ